MVFFNNLSDLIKKAASFVKEGIKNVNIQKNDIETSLTHKRQTADEVVEVVNRCIEAEDYYLCIDKVLLSDENSKRKKFLFCCLMADIQHAKGNNLEAISLLNRAKLFIEQESSEAEHQLKILSQKAAKLNQEFLALDFLLESIKFSKDYLPNQKEKILRAYSELKKDLVHRRQHGQDLLIQRLEQLPPSDKKLILVEIGTTREDVPGQGSTLQLAELCRRKNIHFITVDMDPHNTAWADFQLKQVDPSFEAINMKGEDYLEQHCPEFDFIFLDAYDFDHGKHSHLRQSRYEKFLGERINEELCHQMHLKCAKEIVRKLRPNGLVCIDDTWLDDTGNWTAKGALAVPYLLEHNFEIVEMRNRAVLMRRS